ncbi:hypothetical protein ACRBEV_21850 [Methylobacterium phyllosphaerae]
MVALPLAHLDDHAIRSRVDVAVVSFGPDPVAASAALRAMAADPLYDLPPPWLLACCGDGRPAGLRTLPVTFKALRRAKAASAPGRRPLRRDEGALRRARRRAAPRRRGPARAPPRSGPPRRAVRGGGSAADLRLRASLLGLAADLGGEEGATVEAAAPRMPVRRPAVRRRPTPPGLRRLAAARPRVAPRHAAGCACAARS